MTVLLAYMAMYYFCAWCLWRSGKNIRSLENWTCKRPEHLPTEPLTEIFMKTLIKG